MKGSDLNFSRSFQNIKVKVSTVTQIWRHPTPPRMIRPPHARARAPRTLNHSVTQSQSPSCSLPPSDQRSSEVPSWVMFGVLRQLICKHCRTWDFLTAPVPHSLTRNHGVHVVREAERHPDEQRRHDGDEEGDERDHQRHAPPLLLVRRRQQVLQRLGRGEGEECPGSRNEKKEGGREGEPKPTPTDTSFLSSFLSPKPKHKLKEEREQGTRGRKHICFALSRATTMGRMRS